MLFVEQFIGLFRLSCLGIAIAAFVLAGCAAKRDYYDVPIVPLPDKFNKMPVEAVTADTRIFSASPEIAGSETVGAPVSNSAENKPSIENRMVKTTASMFSDAFFKFDSDQLTPEAMTALNSVVETLRKTWYSGNIHLIGHTCDIGTEKYNQNLSERRALSIKKYLVETGLVSPDTIIAEGQGENNPRYPNTKESRYKNRRVDLEFVTFTDELENVALPPGPGRAETAKSAEAAKIEWSREYVETEPAWLASARHNTAPHKQSAVADGMINIPAGMQSNSAKPPATPLENVLDEWWRLLGSPELDALVDRAFANNHDLRIAAYRIAQAEARAGQASADKAPTITAPVEVGIESPYNGVGTVPPGGNRASKKTYKASIRGDWRVDIWGERQAAYEASDFRLWNATFQRDDVQRKLIANVASAYMEYLSLNDRLRVAHETEEVLSGMVESSNQRMQKGDATVIDLEQMRTAVYAVRATIPVMELYREQALNYIAWLVGAVPGTLTLSERGLDSLSYPAVLPGMPSTLLLRRPDVRAIEAQLLANDANVDTARTRVLPPLDLSAQVGYGSRSFSQWFQSQNLFWSAIANLSATIFDSGKLSKEVDYARAVHEELVESYVQVIYGAVREVEDSLMNVQMMGRRLQAQQLSVNAARRAYDFSSESYAAGAIDHLVLLDTQRTYHSKLDELHQVAMNRYQGLAQLFSALGGGVRRGEAIPGKGLRPELPLETGTVLASAPQALPLDGVDFANNRLEGNDELWLAELPAVSDIDSIGAALRDLRERFPKLMADRFLLPRQLGRVVDKNKNEGLVRAAWYRLFVAQFTASDTAEEFCTELRSRQMRCRVVSSRSKKFLEGASAPKAAPVPASTQAGVDALSSVDTPALKLASEIGAAEPGSPEPDVAVAPASSVAIEGAAGQRYAVQLGTFPSQAKAVKAVTSLQKKGYAAYIYKATGSHGRTWFTVRLGNFSRLTGAAAMATAIRQKGRINAVPVPMVSNGAGNSSAADSGALSKSGGES